MSRLYILGAGGFGFEVALICDRLLAAEAADFTEYVFLDDDSTYARERGAAEAIHGPIAGHVVDPEARYICAIGHPAQRKYVVTKLADANARFVNIIDPRAVVSDRARLGKGIIVCANGFVSAFTTVGNHVHMNVSSSIGHDVVLGDFATLSAHVDLTGYVRAGEGAFFGTNASVLPKHSVGAWARIGAGCSLSRSVKDEAIVYSEPPKFLSRGKD